MRKVFVFVSIYLVVCVLFGLVALLLAFPLHPITIIGWMVWFAATLPVAAAGESIGSTLFSTKIGTTISPDTKRLSAGRIGYGLVVMLVFLGLVFFIADLLGTAGASFWDINFSRVW